MTCKFCNHENLDESVFCAFCGKRQDEEAEKLPVEEEAVPAAEEAAEAVEAAEEVAEEMVEQTEQEAPAAPIPTQETPNNAWKVIAIAACVLLVALLALVIWMSVRDSLPEKETTAPTVATVAPTTKPVSNFDTYQGTDAEITAAADTVVATLGEYTLTNRQLQVFYWTTFYEFVEYSGNYLTNLGLDYTKPLNTQPIPDGTQSWEQYFVDLAFNNWQRYIVLGIQAKEAGMELDAETKDLLATFPTALEENASSYGYATAQEMIQEDYGMGITMEDYLWYMEVYYLGMQYYDHLYAAQQPTREEVSAYFDTVAENYLSYGITKDSGKLVDVRHILIQPEGAQVDASTGYVTATDAQWEACRAEAQAILDGWAQGEATAEAFGKLAVEHSEDGGSAENGGLYSNVGKGQMVEAFDAWIFDESRKEGDTGLVKTEFGYHIMYFAGGDDGWYRAAQPELVQSMTQEALNALLENYPVEPQKDLICIDSAVLGMYKQ